MHEDLLVMDFEATGADAAVDRITQVAIKRVGKTPGEYQTYVNPGRPIPKKVQEITRITDEMVASAPKFADVAGHICSILGLASDAPEARDYFLVAYNGLRFDVGLLWEELARCGIKWEPDLERVIDPGSLFKIREPRDLTSALMFYCNKTMEGAHDAMNDVRATLEVFNGQLDAYPDLAALPLSEIAKASQFGRQLDVHGKLALNEEGHAVYTFGKARDVRVVDDPGFGRWMLSKDFSEHTKAALRKIFREMEAESDTDDLPFN
jgi:DNA polymerase III subunit epsilon